ncbi:MAG: hypothetical protein KC636_08565 [Myxococcales bacterium]|nr:hypothetical protein [Myxococcales bacterium]
MRQLLRVTAAILLITPSACSSAASDSIPDGSLQAEVWADNWFALYIGDEKIHEDSVSITTERSFNAETFTFAASYPVTLAFVIRDYIEDDTGLEYIGAPNQQMGDGGFIAQLKDSTGAVVAVSSSQWRCLVIHRAPTNKSCEKDPDPSATCMSEISAEPDGWRDPDFDDSGWQAASEYSEGEVGPKEGYDEIDWDPSAKLIWTSDLETDNTLLCRVTITGP